jgi:hypothetical protein
MTDREAIQDVITRYCDAITRRDWIALKEVFAVEALWEVIGGPAFRYTGVDIAPGIQRIVESTSTLTQINGPALIDINGDHATARSTIYEFGETLDKTSRFEEPGTYDDVLKKIDGKWRFTSRRFTIRHFRSMSITG